MHTLTLHLDRPLIQVALRTGNALASPTAARIGNGAPSHPKKNVSDPHQPTGSSSPAAKSQSEQIAILNQIKLATDRHLASQSQALEEFLDSVVPLSIRIANAIVGTMVELTSERLVGLIKDALPQFGTDSGIVIRLNPTDYERLADTSLWLPASSTLNLVADEKIAVGDCQLTSPKLTLVADRERLIKEIERRLCEELHRE